MKTQSITDQILKQQSDKIPGYTVNSIASVIASFFAAVFSLSILREVKIEEPGVFILLLVFTILFLSYNEYIKVGELRKKFSGKGGSITLIIITFLISIVLSGIGIYLWTNKTLESSIANDKILYSSTLSVENKFNRLIDSVSNISITNDPEYKRLKTDLSYWKYRNAADIEERTQIRERVKKIEEDLNQLSTSFKKEKENTILRYQNLKKVEIDNINSSFKNENKYISRNNNLSLIFFIIVLITKFVIILLAKEHASIEKKKNNILESEVTKRFVSQYKFVTDILSRKDKITFDDVVFSSHFKFSKDPDKKNKEVKNIYYFLCDIKASEAPLHEAQAKLKNYYENIINL